MKKLLSLILFLSFLTLGNITFAQDEVIVDSVESVSDTSTVIEEGLASEVVETNEGEEDEIIFLYPLIVSNLSPICLQIVTRLSPISLIVSKLCLYPLIVS